MGLAAIVIRQGFQRTGGSAGVGSNTLRAVAADRAGNRGETSIQVERESALEAAPVLDPVASPTNQASIQISGSAPAGAATITVTGGVTDVSVAPAAGRFTATVFLNSNRLNILVSLA
jgi:hypothetical protein